MFRNSVRCMVAFHLHRIRARLLTRHARKHDYLEIIYVLHIPVAIDYFYEYLKTKHNPEGVHWFALYIDLRLYDSTCSDEEKNLEEIGEMAIRIFAEYLEDGAEYQVQLDPLVHQRFIEKFN